MLLLSEEEMRRLQKKILGGRLKEIWEKLREKAKVLPTKYGPDIFDNNLNGYDEIFWFPTSGGYSNTTRTLASAVRVNGFVYAFGGEREAGDVGRRSLLKMAEWPSSLHSHIFNQGQSTYWLGGFALLGLLLGYDRVYDLIEPAERKEIAAALYAKGIINIFKECIRDNRVSPLSSNWISHVTGGRILNALAVSLKDKDSELEPDLTGMILKLADLDQSAFNRDGHYGDGNGYHNFTMQTLS